MCTQHSERLVIFMYTKTNLLLTKPVVLVLVDDVDYGRVPRYAEDCLVRPCCCLPVSSRRVADAVLLMNDEMSLVLPFLT